MEKQHPNLTKNEKRLSALLIMNLKSQEIADILSVALSTVNKNRQRLRKKLNLSTNSDITHYLKTEIHREV
jgi:DNA-binding CsgD family transcriptional regulator